MTGSNRLASTTSPYLIQHRDNPVHWQPWDDQALAEAARRDQPILLSIGYAACHWCHVMAHESFEDLEIAALMNTHFVNIKVDREERPDLDQIYQHALALMGQQGGWPLTMFLTPDTAPFWGGTYFPPRARYGRPGFIDVLNNLQRIWQTERFKVDSNREILTSAIKRLATPRTADDAHLPDCQDLARRIMAAFDPVHGGFAQAPKFPNVPVLDFLWRQAERAGDDALRRTVTHTLNRICQGGTFDHVGGGFARYAVDEIWLVPHFEKMLYDNALLVGLLADVWADSREPLFEVRTRETIDWLQREMIVEDGFASSLDADSEGEEGRYYVWDADEIKSALGGEAAKFCQTYGVTAEGNWEGRSILNRLHQNGLGSKEEEHTLRRQLNHLLTIRQQRVPPGRDDKVLTDWNGMMISALARAAARFSQPVWRELAERAFFAISTVMADGDRLAHSWRAGQRLDHGFLDDYAAMADAALALYQLQGDPGFLGQAEQWVACLDRIYRDSTGGGYFLTAADSRDVLVRPKTARDGPTPSGNGLLATVLVRLFDLTGNTRYRQRAEELLRVFAGEAARDPVVHATLLSARDLLEHPFQIVITGDRSDRRRQALQESALAFAPSGATILRTCPGETLPDGHPANGKAADDAAPAAFVCQDQTCRAPVTEAADLVSMLQAARRSTPELS